MVSEERAARLLQELIRAESENPPGNEYNTALIVKQEMEEMGMETTLHEFSPHRPNVVGVLEGIVPGRRLLITPHSDVVPAGEGWSHDPYGGEIEDGKIYGRGASDCKVNVAACLEAVRSLIEEKAPLSGTLILAVTVDEEKGSTLGLIPLLENGVVTFDHAVVADHNNFEIVIAQKGLLHLTITLFGKKAHGAYPWLGKNAIELAAAVIRDLQAFPFVYDPHPLLREPTASVGTIRGGDAVNIIPDRCEFELDIRYLPGMRKNSILKSLRSIVRRHTRRYRIVVEDHQLPYVINGEDPMVQCLLQSARNYRRTARLAGSEGAAPLAFFTHGNAVATGFGVKNVAHQTDEYARIRDLADGARVLEEFIRRYLS
jgi:succinyl-diaminopimelate desuccinylase